MRFRDLLAVPLVAVALLGCGSDGGGGGGGGGGAGTVPAGATLIRAEEGITWDAKTYTATAIDGKVTISLRNESSLPHNLHLLDANKRDVGISLSVEGHGDLRTDSLALDPGTYQVVCTIPGHGNMKATLTVGGG